MGKLIDADRLKEVFSKNVVGGNAYFDLIDNAPTIEAIPKADYENRLKDDMVAMLTDIQLEIEEIPNSYEHKPIGTYDYCLGAEHERKANLELIQQKINALKGGE